MYPARAVRGVLTHTLVCAHPGACQGRKQSVSVPCLLSFGAGEESLGKSEVSNSRGPAFPELPPRCTTKAPSLFASAARSAFISPAAGQPAALEQHQHTVPLHPAFLWRCGKSSPAPSRPILDHGLAHVPVTPTTWVTPHSSNTAAFNTRFLLPLVLSLGHLWLLLLGTA